MSQEPVSPSIIPVFIPEQGCPHRCVFCDQAGITGRPAALPGRERIRRAVAEALEKRSPRGKRPVEVAFYGGTLTGLPEEKIRGLLEPVRPFLDNGLVHAIRVSTRPDALDEEKVRLLRTLGVGTVEVGAHSMDDGVLERSRRGHTAAHTRAAVGLLRRRGLRVVVQVMVGLPGDSAQSLNRTVEELIALRPHMARLYPVLVLEGTPLARWTEAGTYRPLALEEALASCEGACRTLEEAGIRVIKIGLLPSSDLVNGNRIVAGPWHPAFGFLVRARLYRKRLLERLPGRRAGGMITIRVPEREIPLVRGYRNEGLRFIKERTGADVVAVEPDETLPPGGMEILTP
ncbi:MAG: radical SAM protein [Deltaproteobacteria bacterium]|nr:radical SAM protein [Deltaproteobacteria bacterium]RLB31172.1 MAG: radical SAM protein [Deltaproteobacteria bacterium]